MNVNSFVADQTDSDINSTFYGDNEEAKKTEKKVIKAIVAARKEANTESFKINTVAKQSGETFGIVTKGSRVEVLKAIAEAKATSISGAVVTIRIASELGESEFTYVDGKKV